MPRESKITEEIIDQLTILIAKGLYINRACDLVGISDTTYRDWMRRGKDEPGTLYAQLNDAIKEAEAEDQQRRVEAIGLAGDGGAVTSRETVTKKDGSTAVIERVAAPDWRAHAKMLESRYREEYAQPRGGILGDVPAGGKLLFRYLEIVTTEGEPVEIMPVIETEGGKE